MTFATEPVEQYLEHIEGETLENMAIERHRKLEELSSIDQMAVESLVSGFHVASNKDAYLRALSMALVRAKRQSPMFELIVVFCILIPAILWTFSAVRG